MAILDLDAFKASIAGADPYYFNVKSGFGSEQFSTNFIGTQTTKRTSSSPVVCDMTTHDCIFETEAKPRSAGAGFFIPAINFSTWKYGGAIVDVDRIAFCMIDRLNEMSGLRTDIITSQTTNLPTAALTRYTTGEGVQMALEMHNGSGNATSLFTVTYTNSAGISGRTSSGMTAANLFDVSTAGNFCPIPLQQGDTGVRSVQSAQFGTGYGNITYNVGITLYKVLFSLAKFEPQRAAQPQGLEGFNFLFGGNGKIPYMYKDACPRFITRRLSPSVGGSPAISGNMYLLDDA